MRLAELQHLAPQIHELLGRFGASNVAVFGSVARDQARPESDIDLLVEFQPLEPTELVDAYFGLEEQLTGSLGTPVDLVMATARRNPGATPRRAGVQPGHPERGPPPPARRCPPVPAAPPAHRAHPRAAAPPGHPREST